MELFGKMWILSVWKRRERERERERERQRKREAVREVYCTHSSKTWCISLCILCLFKTGVCKRSNKTWSIFMCIVSSF